MATKVQLQREVFPTTFRVLNSTGLTTHELLMSAGKANV